MQNQIIHNNMMQNGEHAVLPNSKWQYYIDKTKQLEKGIIAFPSIYIEGSAASGKTTAVEMLLDKYPQQEVRLFQMEKEWKEKNVLLEKIGKLAEEVKKKELWIVFDNMPEKNSVEYISKVYNQNQMEAELQEKQILESLVSLVKNLPQHSKIIFTGRGKLPGEFLELLWKRKIELFTIQSLLFTKEEIRILAEKWKSGLNYGQVYEKTGGWAGCVDMLFRFSDSDFRYGKKVRTIDELMDSYEIKEYIHREVMDTLPAGEQKLLSHAAGCPWITESLCQAIWKNKAQKSGKMQGPEIRQEPEIQRESEKIPAPEWYMDILDNLTRKGILLYNRKKKNWTISPLLLNYLPMNHVKDEEMDTEASSWLEQAAVWYEENGHVDEALYCLRQCKKRDRYLEYMKQHYAQLSFSGYQYPGVKNWRDKTPEACYLRGMYDYMVQNFTGLEKEIHMLENMQEKDQKTCEILLNLYYLKPDFSLNQWLELLEQYTGKEKMHLYHMLGNSCTFLCGVRDLSALFACTRKEENQKARVWKECLGKEEWRNYQLARIDFYLETGRQDAILEEDRILLEQENEKEQLLPERGNTKQQLMENWQFLLVKFYLLNKLQVLEQNTSYKKQIQELEQQLMQENQELCVRNTEAISALYAGWYGVEEKMMSWLRQTGQEGAAEIGESNYIIHYCQAKAYLRLNQYEKAGKVVKRLIPYHQAYHRYRFQAEHLFQQAIVTWDDKMRSQAVRNAIESFLITGNSRYIVFYTEYGQRGREVLENYVEWMQNNSPEKWHRKKKYNYGNVLRMPQADYMDVILRNCKKNVRKTMKKEEEALVDKLTLMEISVLQSIRQGKSNAEICEELHLKLPTVKSHIYNLYRKLEVNTRVQAIIKGKELGLLE